MRMKEYTNEYIPLFRLLHENLSTSSNERHSTMCCFNLFEFKMLGENN